MGVDISQHRASIGSFNNVINRYQTYKIKPTFNHQTYRIPYFKALIIISILISSLVSIYQSDIYYHTASSKNHQCSYQPGQVYSDITLSSYLPFSFNVLAASSFSLVSNFHSRYVNGNKRNQGIKICHWNKGGSHLKNKMPEIRNLIGGLNPHILGISEANLHQSHDPALVHLTD